MPESTARQKSSFFGHADVPPTVYSVMMGMFIALYVVLERFLGINLLTFKLNLSFVPLILAAYYFGPLGGMLCGALGDIAGALLVPTGGYNPLFTLTAALVGLIFGLFLMGEFHWWRVVCPALLAGVFGTLCLNTLWISLFFSPKGFWPLFLGRLPEAGLTFAAECLLFVPLLGRKWVADALHRR